MPYKDPEKRRAKARDNAQRRREQDKVRYETDPEYREKKRLASRARYERNKDKIKAQVREYRRLNPHMQWAANLKKYEGMTIEVWTELLIAQSGRCAICSDPMRSPHVDHDHGTGAVRGLLCDGCNHGLGKFKDSTDLLACAIVYLKRSRAA